MDQLDVLSMVETQATRFAEMLPDFGAFGFIYGWVFVFSLLTAVITFGFVIFRRESGAVSGSLIVQWFAVWALPLIVSSTLEALGGSEEATEGAFLLVSLLL